MAAAFLFAGGREGKRRREKMDRVKMRTPIAGDIWLKYQVAQFARMLSTLLTGGIPLVQALETAADSLGTPLLRQRARESAARWCGKGSRFRAR